MAIYIEIDNTGGSRAPMDIIFWFKDNGFTLNEARMKTLECRTKANGYKTLVFWDQVYTLLMGI